MSKLLFDTNFSALGYVEHYVDLHSILENHIRGCHGNNAFSLSPYINSSKENFVLHSEGSIEQVGIY